MTPAQKVTAVALYREGKGPAAIAAFLGLSYDVVWAYLQFEARFTDGVLSEPRRANIDEPGTSLGNGVGSGAFSPILQTNGVLNTTQNLLNLIAGTGISLAADLAGGVTITNTGTSSFGNQVANSVFAGPTAGAAQLPTFRALVNSDLIGISLGPLGFGSGANVFGLTQVSVHKENMSSGDVDVYTVPVGSRAILISNIWNSAGTTTTFFSEIKVSGVYYRVSANTTLATLVASNFSWNIVLEAGETFSVNLSQAGINLFGTVFVFPNTEKIKSAKLLSLASGNNTLYTCPAGKVSSVVLSTSLLFGNGVSVSLLIANGSGGSLNYFANNVLSGGSPATANRFTALTTIANLVLSGFVTNNWTLNPGDFINVNASGTSANTATWITVQEN